MSYPNIPDINSCINITSEDAAKLILASIAFEELSLAHLLNASAEEIQYVLGTLEGQEAKDANINELLRIDASTKRLLHNIIKKEILLNYKLEDTINFIKKLPVCNPADPLTIPKYVDSLPIPSVLQPKSINNEIPYYEVSMQQIKQKLHKCFPETLLWGYEGSYPGPTIETRTDQTIHVKWINDLPITPHLLPVDKTVHGAMPPSPDVRTVVHLHGARVSNKSDGFPEAWFTNNFQDKGPEWSQEIYEYPNQQRATTLWYHDHALGITRLNVYAGLAGLYLIRNNEEDALNIPKGEYEIPLAIQDRSFNSDGSLFYPAHPENPDPNFPNPSIIPEFFGNTILVNGKVWPYLKVEPRKYRFRILNGCNSRFLRVKLSSGQSFNQIGTEGGLLEVPVVLNEITLGPAERADVIIDFSNNKDQCIIMTNNAESPFPMGDAPDPDTTGQIMQFRVVLPLKSQDTTIIPPHLSDIEILKESDSVVTRNQTLEETTDIFGRLLLLLEGSHWTDPIITKPSFNTIEVWNLVNLTMDTHPIHLHLVHFQVLDRIPFDVQNYDPNVGPVFTGPPVPPDPNEIAWKDTVKTPSEMVTRIIARFDGFKGVYPWHCHIIEHEDHDMMRPYEVV